MTMQIRFDNSYARLASAFHASVLPTPVSSPRLVALNHPLAIQLGLDPAALESPEGVEVLAGKRIPEGAEPIAAAYAGHQFGSFVPRLGDGRAILLGEVIDASGCRRDIQLKGSGRTPFSRMGDGRAALGPVLREYIVSEAMAALGIPTTRALAAVVTGDPVYRETALPGAILTRVASSHIRVGTFQYFAAGGDLASLKALADHVIARHYPEAADAENPYLALLDGVIARQAALVARWMLVGFIHGVMNTDNMSVAGETIDYGPCAFMDVYDPATVFSSIDEMGRYAYANQPHVARWNLARFAESLLPLIAEDLKAAVDRANVVFDTFPERYKAAHLSGMRRKLGLASEEEDDRILARDLLDLLAENRADFTVTFRGLSETGDMARDQFLDVTALDGWAARWRERLSRESTDEASRLAMMRSANPAVIPRNFRVEEAIAAAVENDDFGPFERLHAALAKPYESRADFHDYEKTPPASWGDYRTFCGT